jgi:hypothetical protein
MNNLFLYTGEQEMALKERAGQVKKERIKSQGDGVGWYSRRRFMFSFPMVSSGFM